MRYEEIKEQDKVLSALIGKTVTLELREECFMTYTGVLKKIRWCENTTLDKPCWEIEIGNYIMEYEMFNEDFTLYASPPRY